MYSMQPMPRYMSILYYCFILYQLKICVMPATLDGTYLFKGGSRFQKEGANRGIYKSWFAKKSNSWLIQLATQ